MDQPRSVGPDQYRTLFQDLPEPAWVYDGASLEFLDVNDAAVRNYGFTREEFLGMTLRDIRPPEDVPILEASVRANRPGFMESGPFRHRRRDGSIIFASIASHDVVFAGRQARLVVARDVTAQRQTLEALERSEERYRDLFENASDVAFTLDLEGRLLDVNKAGELASGWPREELLGRRLAEHMPPDSRELMATMVARKLSGATAQTSYEIRLLRRDGAPVTLEVSSRLVYGKDGRPVGVQGIARDVTERKRLEADLLQAQKMDGIGRLAGGIAHDFNNVLTAILGQAELARLAAEDGEIPRHEIEQIAAAARRAAGLTRQLLAFARKERPEPQIVSLNELILEVDKLLRRLIGEHISLVTVPGPALGPVRADPAQLEQVLVNLAVNARDAMPQGGRLTVETANVVLKEEDAVRHPGLKPGPYVMLAVSDTGVGMEPEVLEHAFEPFFTTKESGKGTGLGLATCYGIAKQNDGHIEAESAPGRGTCVRVYLPRATEAAVRARAVADSAPLSGGRETVLVAEDETPVRELEVKALEMAGYRVLAAASGTEALVRARSHEGPLDLLVADLVMPQMGGRELAEELRRLHPGLRVLFVSGYSGEAAVQDGLAEKGSAFLAKPYSALEFAQRVRSLLDSTA